MSLTALFNGLQSIANAMLATSPDTCNVLRVTETRSPQGGTLKNWTVLNNSPIRCFYAPAKGVEQIIAGEAVSVGDYMIILPAGTDVKAKDRVVIAARGGVAALTMEITAVLQQNNVQIQLMARAQGQ